MGSEEEKRLLKSLLFPKNFVKPIKNGGKGRRKNNCNVRSCNNPARPNSPKCEAHWKENRASNARRNKERRQNQRLSCRVFSCDEKRAMNSTTCGADVCNNTCTSSRCTEQTETGRTRCREHLKK